MQSIKKPPDFFQSSYFQDYTEENLQQDLNQLVEWKNLIPRQDTGKVTSIEDLPRQFRRPE